MPRRDVASCAVVVVGGLAVYELLRHAVVRWWLSSSSSGEEKAEDSPFPQQQQQRRALPAEMVDEMLSRHEAFFGAEGQARVRSARVAVIGLGGVGSHCAVMLARAGVSFLRIVDFDNVSLSSLNRHAVASLSDVGTLKTKCIQDFVARTAPFVQVDARGVMFDEASSHSLLGDKLDLVVDCIDDVRTKALLIAACARRKLQVLSAMGAGAKADPTRLCVSSLEDAIHDPLASKLRWKLRGELLKARGDDDNNNYGGCRCVYSHERPTCALLPLTEEQLKQGAEHFGTVDHFRVRVLPVLGTMPALMGQALAAVSLCDLAHHPLSPAPREPLSKRFKEKMLKQLRTRESRREFGPKARPDRCDWIDVTPDELEYVIAEVWRGRCAVTRTKLERRPLCLARWRTSIRPFFKQQQQQQHDNTEEHSSSSTVKVLADELVLLTPELAERLDAAFDQAQRGDDLFRAAAKALGSDDAVRVVDARIHQMRLAAGGPWVSAPTLAPRKAAG